MYHVEFGYCLQEFEAFATFEEALVFYRGYLTAQMKHCEGPSLDAGPKLVNPDNIDGAEDASVAAQHGLTRDEWERVEAVG